MTRVQKYLAICDWALARYTRPDGSRARCVGNGIAGRPSIDGRAFMVPSRSSMIEDLAARRYLDCAPAWPGETLSTAYSA